MDIGRNIRKLRNKAALTQEEVAAKLQVMGCDISRVTYAKIEGNHYNIRISELVALKILFHVEYKDFFDGLEEKILLK